MMHFSASVFPLQLICRSGHVRNVSEIRPLPFLNAKRLPTILRIKARVILLIHEPGYPDAVPDTSPASPVLPLFTSLPSWVFPQHMKSVITSGLRSFAGAAGAEHQKGLGF